MCGKWYSLSVDVQYDGLRAIGEKVRQVTEWDKKDPNWPMEGAEFETIDGTRLCCSKMKSLMIQKNITLY